MNTAAVVVILLFFVSIVSSVQGPGGVSSHQKVAPEVIAAQYNDQSFGKVPGAGYDALDAEEPQLRIYNFIMSYGKGVDQEDAKTMSRCIMKSCKNYDMNPFIITSLIARESRFNKRATSGSGARGLGQLLDSTAGGLHITDPYDIEQNIDGTTRYFKSLVNRWPQNEQQVPLALGCYVEGINAIRDHGRMSGEASQYAKDIIATYWKI